MNVVKITWGLFGGIFIYVFLANFRTMLLMPQYDKPIDSAQDVLDRGMIPFVDWGGDYYRDHLLQSSNPAYQTLGGVVVVPKDWDTCLIMYNKKKIGLQTLMFILELYMILRTY